MWKEMFSAAVRHISTPFLIGSLILLVLAATGGSEWYWVVVRETEWRVILGIVGLVSFIAAIYFANHNRNSKINFKNPGLRITSPTPNSPQGLGALEVSGTSDSKPKNVVAWIFTISGSGAGARYWAQDPLIFSEDGKTWHSKVWSLGGQKGEKKQFGVFLVGPSGEKLIDLYKRAGEELKAANGKYLPLTQLTDDMLECHSISVEIV